jgi:uncharacterized protein YcaQ
VPLTLQRLRAHAISRSLFRPTTLKAAIHRLGFVQADPIRLPARAQDLILRQRVAQYRAGDLERLYPSLDIEEDLLYAYGFLSRPVWQLLHPRSMTRLTVLESKVLAAVHRFGAMHPKDLQAEFGRARVVNAWGGYSKATKCALEHLHYRGFLRIARRDNGIRIYEPAPPPVELLSSKERLRQLVLVVARILAPALEKTLQAIAARLRRSVSGSGDHRQVLRDLIGTGELEKQTIDGLTYVWPPSRAAREESPRRVHFLAPFDPLVWDRRRFEHLWQWSYRFEAYTPPAKRFRGYYALPLLWGDRVIGWANVRAVQGHVCVEPGFVEKRPRDADFEKELEAETSRMETFLGLNVVPE